MGKVKVLFLCTHNSARSQMAEAFLKKYAGEYFDAFSAGLDPQGIDPHTIQVMNEAGLPLEGQTSKSVKEYLGNLNFGYLITVCDYAEKNCPTAFLGISHRMHWAFDDPVKFEGSEEEKLDKFRQVRDQVDAKIQSWLAEVQS